MYNSLIIAYNINNNKCQNCFTIRVDCCLQIDNSFEMNNLKGMNLVSKNHHQPGIKGIENIILVSRRVCSSTSAFCQRKITKEEKYIVVLVSIADISNSIMTRGRRLVIEHQNSNPRTLCSIPLWGRVEDSFSECESPLAQTCVCLTPLRDCTTYSSVCAC